MISSLITPVRWYTDIFESDRFSNDCDICQFELISDKTRLLPFQFRRPKSGYPISKWTLRKECENVTTPLFNTNDSLFTLDSGYWSAAPITIGNGKANFVGGSPASTVWKTLFTVGKYYLIKIVVSEYEKVTPTFSFKMYYKTAKKFDITGPGTYYTAFIADSTNLVSVATTGASSDKITFDSIEISEIEVFNTLTDDIELPTSLLTVANISLTEDVIQYVGDEFDFQIPCGKYYMIMCTDDYDVFYSELITVKDFIPSQSPYTMLEWVNHCDISDVIYQPIQTTEYINRMYIDSDLTKPVYPFKEEGEEDGNFKLNVLFQKLEKQVSLMVASCPEFIVDALTAIRLHDTVTITKPIREKQLVVTSAFEVEKVETELSSIFSDCSTNCELKITMKDVIVDSTCCTNTEMAACIELDHEFTEDLELVGRTFFGEPTFYSLPKSLYLITSGISLPTTPSTYTGGGQFYFTGDQTADFPVGTKVRMTGTYDGIHIVTVSAFAIGTTLQFDPPVTASDTGLMYKITVADIAAEALVVESNGITYQYQSGTWETISKINSFSFTPGTPDEFYVQGTTYLNTFVKFQFTTFNLIGPTTVITTYNKIYTAAQFKTGITIHNDLALVPLVSDGTITIKAICFALNCPYDDSDNAVIVFP